MHADPSKRYTGSQVLTWNKSREADEHKAANLIGSNVKSRDFSASLILI